MLSYLVAGFLKFEFKGQSSSPVQSSPVNTDSPLIVKYTLPGSMHDAMHQKFILRHVGILEQCYTGNIIVF